MNNNITRPALLPEQGKRLSADTADTAEKTQSLAKDAIVDNLPKQQATNKSLSPQALATWLAKQSDKVTATVVSSTPLSAQTLVTLAKVNPELSRTIAQLQVKTLAPHSNISSPSESLKSTIGTNTQAASPKAPLTVAIGTNAQAAPPKAPLTVAIGTNAQTAPPKAPLTVAMVNKIINDASTPLLATNTNNLKTAHTGPAAASGSNPLLVNNKAELGAALATQLIHSSNSSQSSQQGTINSHTINDKQALFAVKLLVGKQPLLTISPTPLAKNTPVVLSASSIQNMATALTEPKAQLNHAQPLILKASPEPTNATQSTVSSIIRQALPQENSSKEILSLLSQFEKISPSIKNVLVPDTINKLTTAIIDSSLDTKQPINTQQLKEGLLNSGLFVENKLAQVNTPLLTNDRRVILEKLISLLHTNGLAKPLAPSDSHLSALASEKIAEIISSINQQPVNTTAHAKPTKPDAFLSLLNALGLKVPNTTLNQPEQLLTSLSQKLQQKMGHLAQANLTKIQLDQIKSLGLDKPAGDMVTANPPLTAELPLRWLDQVLPLTLHISQREEQSNEQEETGKKESNEKVKKWQVMMSFDLPDDQRLHVQLSLVEHQCSALLWAESPQLCQTANKNLSALTHKLEAIGLTVDAIECFEGKPQTQQSPLGYQLVDIKT